MTARARIAIVAYVVLGAVLAAIGFLVALGANLGVLTESPTLRAVALAAGLVLVFIGAHISVAGVGSLRASAD